MKKSFLITLIVSFITNISFSQEIYLKTNFPTAVDAGEQFYISYETNVDSCIFQVGSFKDLSLLNGPAISTSNSFIFKDGKRQSVVKRTYSYLLCAFEAGKYTIPIASITVDSTILYSETKSIEVKKAPHQLQRDSLSKIGISKDDLFLVFSLSKNEVFIQEPIIATIKLYSKPKIWGINHLKLPSYDDFLFYDIINDPQLVKEDFNGKFFNSIILEQKLLYPQKNGVLQIEGTKLNCSFLVESKIKSNNLLAFFPENNTIEQSIESGFKKILVKPLPKKQPVNFSGICGTEIKLTTQVHNSNVKTNENFTYEVILSGNGNLKIASTLAADFPKELEIVDYANENNLRNSIDGISGSRVFRYTISPRKEGIFKIPELSLSYFDLDLEQYITVHSQSVVINVEKGYDALFTQNDKASKVESIEQKKSKKNDLVFVLDISSSMKAQDFIPNRLKAAIRSTKEYISKQDKQIGLVLFSETSELKCPLSNNHSAIIDSLYSYSKTNLGDGTAIGMGLGIAISELKDSNAKRKSIILLTDGENNKGNITNKMAIYLANYFRIRIYVIGISSKDSLIPYPIIKPTGDEYIANVPIDLNEEPLRVIANSTGGKYFRATDIGSLDSIYGTINTFINEKNLNTPYENYFTDVVADKILDVIKQDTYEAKKNLKKAVENK